MTYWVIIMHQEGKMPQLMRDKMGETLTLDSPADAKDTIVAWWRSHPSYDRKVLRMTVVKLKD